MPIESAFLATINVTPSYPSYADLGGTITNSRQAHDGFIIAIGNVSLLLASRQYDENRTVHITPLITTAATRSY